MAFRLVHLHSTRHHIRNSIPHLVRTYHDYVRYATPGGPIRVPLFNSKIIGTAVARGEREYQEDFHAFAALSLNPEELRRSVKRHHGIEWDPQTVGEPYSRQVVFIGIYDGHGGSTVSQYLRQEFHGLFESVDKSHIPEMYEWIKEIDEMDLNARSTLAFFEVDRNLSGEAIAKTCGSTASVAILHSLDAPASPFWSAQKLALTVAHVGDTRVLLCSTDGARVVHMTENHHADARIESSRLRRMMGTSLITDSFGDARWMGALENTRSLGDLKWKPFGVTPEPEVRTKLLTGEEWAYMVIVSDGISSVVSDGEIVDLARDSADPKQAAETILRFAEEMGSTDNVTAIVVPFAGWGKIRGPDKTKDLREYRRRQMAGMERHNRM